MGYEFQLYTDLNETHIQAIDHILKGHPHFYKGFVSDNQLHYEFRTDKSGKDMPDFAIIVNVKGIYICKNNTSDVWRDLDALKKHVETTYPDIKIEEL